MKCQKGLEIKVLSSGGGNYIGTQVNDDGFIEPNCRISNYYGSKEEATKALDDRAFGRVCPENTFCHGGRGCGLSD